MNHEKPKRYTEGQAFEEAERVKKESPFRKDTIFSVARRGESIYVEPGESEEDAVRSSRVAETGFDYETGHRIAEARKNLEKKYPNNEHNDLIDLGVEHNQSIFDLFDFLKTKREVKPHDFDGGIVLGDLSGNYKSVSMEILKILIDEKVLSPVGLITGPEEDEDYPKWKELSWPQTAAILKHQENSENIDISRLHFSVLPNLW